MTLAQYSQPERFEKEEVESSINKRAFNMGAQTVVGDKNPSKG